MSKLWLWLLPALCLPSLGMAQQTQFGNLQLSDFIIWPYVVLVYWSGRNNTTKYGLRADNLKRPMLLFLYWAILVTLLNALIGGGTAVDTLIFSLLKIGKLSLYAAAGLLTSKALIDDEVNRKFNWWFLASGVVIGSSLLITRYSMLTPFVPIDMNEEQFYVNNLISVSLAIIIAYFIGLFLTGYGSKQWRFAAMIGILIMVLGITLASGRGGWVALFAALIYIFYRLTTIRVFLTFIVGAIIVVMAYNTFPFFRDRVDQTIQPDPGNMSYYHTDLAGTGIESGARWLYWTTEGVKFLDAPMFGRGFFNRGGESELDPVGSHNFFIQMFLETGIAGGMLVLFIFLSIWREPGPKSGLKPDSELPVKSAVVAAFVGGLTGEYFYGGIGLLVFLLAYSAVGRLPINAVQGRHSLYS